MAELGKVKTKKNLNNGKKKKVEDDLDSWPHANCLAPNPLTGESQKLGFFSLIIVIMNCKKKKNRHYNVLNNQT